MTTGEFARYYVEEQLGLGWLARLNVLAEQNANRDLRHCRIRSVELKWMNGYWLDRPEQS